MRQSSVFAFVFSMAITISAGCSTKSIDTVAPDIRDQTGRDASRLLVVDCLLPGQLRSLGRSMTFLTPRRPIKASASECEIRGGEYVSFDRANFSTSLNIWLPKAKAGDAKAQTYVGEIFEKGLGQVSDPKVAAEWYAKAAAQGNARAQINLGYLYESGLGVDQNLVTAMNYYRTAAGLEDSNLEYVTSLEVAARKARQQEAVDMQKEIASLQADNEALLAQRSKFEQQQAALVRLEREISEKQQQIAQLLSQKENSTSPPSDEDKQSEEVAQLVSEIANLDDELESSEAKNSSLVAELSRQQQVTSALRKSLANTDSELREARSALESQQMRIASIEQQLQKGDSAEVVKKQLINELAVVRSEIVEKQKTIEVLQKNQSADSRKLSSRLAEAERRERELKASLDSARDRIEQLDGLVEAKEIAYQEKLAALKNMESSTTSSLLGKQREIYDLRKRVSELQAMDVVNQSSIDDANQKITFLEKEVRTGKQELQQSISYKKQANLAAVELAALEDQLKFQRQLTGSQQSKIEALERNVANQRASIPESRAADRVVTTVASGPMIEIIEPPVTILRGAFAVPIPSQSQTLELIGRVRPPERVISFKVNGSRNDINSNGIFTYQADVTDTTQLTLTAVDDAGERAEIKLSLAGEAIVQTPTSVNTASSRGADPRPVDVADLEGIEFGRYHALIIGNRDYQNFGNLRTSINDVLDLERVLRKKYGFSTELLQNADRYEILAALNRKRDELTENDNLLIYYAGHGELADGKGYWLPVDSDPDSSDNWISSLSVTDLVDSMSAKHVMIVADSCYSGTLSRSSVPRLRKELSVDQKLQWYENISDSKVRTVFTSGGVRPVIDGLPDSRNSIFADALINELESGNGVVEAYSLFLKVQDKVKRAAGTIGMVQEPRYSPIKYAGHESGEFLFVDKDG